jgi:hypothetical protein
MTLILCLLISSCTNSSDSNISSPRYSFSEYQNALYQYGELLNSGEYSSFQPYLQRWWDCDSYRSGSRYLETQNLEPWKLFGYCLWDIDTVINNYLRINNPKDDQMYLTVSDKNLVRELRLGDQEGYTSICNHLINQEIRNEFQLSQQGAKNLTFVTDEVRKSITSGCVMRFDNSFGINIKFFEISEEHQQEMIAQEKQAELEAAQEAEKNQPIDTNSREYITGLTIGNNFSNYSDANESAEVVCARARDKRVVLSSNGGIGVDPKSASFLKTKNGFQGCVDGFNGVPQD